MSSNAPSGLGGAGSAHHSAPTRNSRVPKYGTRIGIHLLLGVSRVDSRFTQQELRACKPILTPGWVITAFMLVSIIFIPIGIASLFASRDVVEIVDRYDDKCLPHSAKSNPVKYIQTPGDKSCSRTLTVPKRMKAPIYVYYQLEHFYQNHRRYVKSRSDEQLRLNKSAESAKLTKPCMPEDVVADGEPIVPCGLIAWSLFNDTYTLSLGAKNLTINKTHISWKSDRERKFGSDVYPKNFQSRALQGGARLDPNIPLSKQEDLIVWMRTAALPTFRKLYGKIEEDLEEKETIQVRLQNYYNTYSFGGKKMLVLSTASWLGGKNDFLGIAYLSVGGLCFLIATLFALAYIVKPRALGDPSYLTWNNKSSGGR